VNYQTKIKSFFVELIEKRANFKIFARFLFFEMCKRFIATKTQRHKDFDAICVFAPLWQTFFFLNFKIQN
jgi:hypothetical protein